MSSSDKKSPPHALRRTLLSMALSACLGAGVGHAQPVGPQVIYGSASFAAQGNTLTVTNSPNAIINWQGFSVGANEIARFVQQNSSSNVLNRVVGQESSAILGALQSNGRVWLINPNGILFGPNARVDVNGLIASTLDIANQDFLAGRYHFNSGNFAGRLDNQGLITTPSGGQIALIAPDVENSGILTTPQGSVMLAAGRSVQLVDTANPDLAVVVSAPEDRALNLGQIVAQGGRVDVYGALINQRGRVSADSAVVGENGKIVFKASKDALLEAGSVTSATGAGQGGEIQVLGERVGLTDNAQIDASGQQGGGTVLVGGDYQGKNPVVLNAKVTYVGSETTIKADAGQQGDGGKVIVWADDTTRYFGAISARGGATRGNGGFAEVSGKNWLDYRGAADLRAVQGKTGALLLDPTNVYIADDQANATVAGMAGTDFSVDSSTPPTFQTGGTPTDSLLTVATLEAALANAAVTVNTASGGGGAGNITVVDGVTWASNNGLDLNATGSIALNAPLSGGGGGITLTAPTGITQLASAPITADSLKIVSSSGAVSMATASNLVNKLAVDMSSGSGAFSYKNDKSLAIDTVGGTSGIVFSNNTNPINIQVTTGDLTLTQGVKSDALGGGDITLSAANALAVNNVITSSNNSTPSGLISLSAGTGGITSVAAGIITASDLRVTSLGDVNLGVAPNVVTNLAAGVGDPSNVDKNFFFKNAAALNLSVIGGTSGISIYNNVGDPGYNYSSNAVGVISLVATGALTQSAGAVLGGRAVRAEGQSVVLTLANPTGIIAGKATGSSTGDTFQYASANGIYVTTVNGQAGIAVPNNNTDSVTIALSNIAGSQGISQDSTGAISTTQRISLQSKGDVNLVDASNSVGGITADLSQSASGTGKFGYKNSGALTVAETGVVTYNQPIHIETASGGLTVSADVNAGSNSVSLKAGGDNSLLSIPASITVTGTGGTAPYEGVKLVGDRVEIAGNVVATGKTVLVSPVTSGRAVTIGNNDVDAATASAGTLGLTTAELALIGANNLIIGDKLVGGNISVNNNFSWGSGWLQLWSAGDISGGAMTITAPQLELVANGTLSSTTGAVSANTVATTLAVAAKGNVSITNSHASGTIVGENSLSGLAGVKSTEGTVYLKSSTGNLTFNKPVEAFGSVELWAAGGVVRPYSSVNAYDVKGLSLNVSNATDGVGKVVSTVSDVLHTQVGSIAIQNQGEACINIKNNYGAASPLTILAVSNNSPSSSVAGNVNIENWGAITIPDDGGYISTGCNPSCTSGGDVSVIAHSPITIAGSISSAGSVTLTAGAANSSNPVDVINFISGSSVSVGAGKTFTLSSNSATGTLPSGAVTNFYTAPTGGGGGTEQPATSDCEANPSLPGCSVTPPPTDPCVADPTASGCGTVAPTLDACVSNPAAPGCAAVLPSLNACVTNPAAPGCVAVLPSLADCTAKPGALGCSAVLPTLDACVANPVVLGCTAVLPSLTDCTANPGALGCALVLPTLDACVANPAGPGCGVVLPSLTDCTVNPGALGCSVVLPKLDTCMANPAALGCMAVLPTLDACMASPAAPGCTVVLPSLTDCTANPGARGCTVVLPPKLPELINVIVKTENVRPLEQVINQTNNTLNNAALTSAIKPMAVVSLLNAPADSGGGASGGSQVGGSISANEGAGRSVGSEKRDEQVADDDKDDKDDKKKDVVAQKEEKKDEAPKKKQYCN